VLSCRLPTTVQASIFRERQLRPRSTRMGIPSHTNRVRNRSPNVGPDGSTGPTGPTGANRAVGRIRSGEALECRSPTIPEDSAGRGPRLDRAALTAPRYEGESSDGDLGAIRQEPKQQFCSHGLSPTSSCRYESPDIAQLGETGISRDDRHGRSESD